LFKLLNIHLMNTGITSFSLSLNTAIFMSISTLKADYQVSNSIQKSNIKCLFNFHHCLDKVVFITFSMENNFIEILDYMLYLNIEEITGIRLIAEIISYQHHSEY